MHVLIFHTIPVSIPSPLPVATSRARILGVAAMFVGVAAPLGQGGTIRNSARALGRRIVVQAVSVEKVRTTSGWGQMTRLSYK